MHLKFKVFSAAVLAVLVTVGMANAQLTLVPNGDFSSGGDNWATAGVGVDFTFPGAGGNSGGYAQIDQTAGNWGGVLVAETDATNGIALGDLGLTAGTTATFSIDMIDLTGNGVSAGMKIENWDGAGNIGDSGDVVFALSNTWQTYTFDYDINAAATSLKFVPLMVVQPVGSMVGFDNVGVVSSIPEPASAGLIALGTIGLVTRRRRK